VFNAKSNGKRNTLKLSIITVCLNSAETIGHTLESVAAQTHREVEHIIVDGVSTDGTLDVVRKHSSSMLQVISEPDRGLYDAMNKGLTAASGDIIGYLNSDDVYASHDVLQKVATALAEPDIDACYGDLVYVQPDDMSQVVRYWRSCAYSPGLVERGWMPAHPTFFVRRSILQKIGGFDIRYRYQSDYELMVRLFLKERISAVHIPEVLVRMRTGGHTNRSIRNIVKGNIEAYRACRENGIKVSPFFILQKMMSRLPQFILRPPQQDSSPRGR
jgi:glycosyltransferase involved in cell wall biosynthesis